MNEPVITAANSITAVGHDGRMTAASVRAGLCRMFICEDYHDSKDNPVTVAPIRGIDDEVRDTADRLAGIAARCLSEMLDDYFRDSRPRLPRIAFILGVSSQERP